jgi:outer membrane protein insertion porin family
MNAPTTLLRSLILGFVLWIGVPLAGAPLVGMLGVSAAQAQTISAISVSGNQRVDKPTIVSFLALRVGQTATRSLINDSIDSLFQSGLFAQVDVDMSGSTLVVKVTENPIISSVLFRGNTSLTDERLSGLVDLTSLGVYSEASVQRGVRSIELAYEKDGYTGVDVSTDIEVQPNARVRVTFVIAEGDRSGIASISFIGNQSIGDWTLASVIKTRQSNLMSWLLRDDLFDQDKIDVDAELIRLHYANNGYPDAQVLSAVAEFDAERNAYYVTFTIEEGDYYRFGDVNIETSVPDIDTVALQREIRMRPGNRYSLADVQSSSQDMALAAAAQGFSFVEVRPRIDRDIANKTFSVTFLVDNGPRLYVERINIFGNNKTRDFVIRREFEFSEGDPFNRSLLAKGQAGLEKLQLFSQVQVSLEPGSASDQVVVNVVVKEVSSGNYGLTAGLSTDEGVLGELSLTERNFLGRGQFLRVAIGATTASRTFEFSFTEPRFMGLKIATGIDLYRRMADEGTYTYGTESTGGQLRATLPVFDGLNVTGYIGAESKTFTDATLPAAPIYATGTLNKIFVGYRLTMVDVDNEQRPSQGFTGQFSQEYIGVDHNLIKTEVKGKYYYPLMPDLDVVGSVRGQAGIINDFSGLGVNPNETFSLGSQLVRGFAGNGYGPRQVGTGDPLGATEYIGVSAEIEFPIPVLPESLGLRGAVYADAAYVGGASIGGGAVVGSGTAVPVRSSVGASIVWDSPFGPLRGNFSQILSADAADETQVFQLTLTSLF